MSFVRFRPDYAKFLIDCHPEEWASWYHSLNAIAHEKKYAGEWLKSHKVNRLWFNAAADMETWSIDIWGEWAGIVEYLPAHWFKQLRRFDARAIVWDANEQVVQQMGQLLCGQDVKYNVHLFNTRPGTKRLGRDRGGVGFAIGSHKSDLRITCYKRTGEPVALEFQMSGNYLRRLREQVTAEIGGLEDICSPFVRLKQLVQKAGEQRLERVMQSVRIKSFYTVLSPADLPELPPMQAAILPELLDEEFFPDQEDPGRPA